MEEVPKQEEATPSKLFQEAPITNVAEEGPPKLPKSHEKIAEMVGMREGADVCSQTKEEARKPTPHSKDEPAKVVKAEKEQKQDTGPRKVVPKVKIISKAPTTDTPQEGRSIIPDEEPSPTSVSEEVTEQTPAESPLASVQPNIVVESEPAEPASPPRDIRAGWSPPWHSKMLLPAAISFFVCIVALCYHEVKCCKRRR